MPKLDTTPPTTTVLFVIHMLAEELSSVWEYIDPDQANELQDIVSRLEEMLNDAEGARGDSGQFGVGA